MPLDTKAPEPKLIFRSSVHWGGGTEHAWQPLWDWDCGKGWTSHYTDTISGENITDDGHAWPYGWADVSCVRADQQKGSDERGDVTPIASSREVSALIWATTKGEHDEISQEASSD